MEILTKQKSYPSVFVLGDVRLRQILFDFRILGL